MLIPSGLSMSQYGVVSPGMAGRARPVASRRGLARLAWHREAVPCLCKVRQSGAVLGLARLASLVIAC